MLPKNEFIVNENINRYRYFKYVFFNHYTCISSPIYSVDSMSQNSRDCFKSSREFGDLRDRK